MYFLYVISGNKLKVYDLIGNVYEFNFNNEITGIVGSIDSEYIFLTTKVKAFWKDTEFNVDEHEYSIGSYRPTLPGYEIIYVSNNISKCCLYKDYGLEAKSIYEVKLYCCCWNGESLWLCGQGGKVYRNGNDYSSTLSFSEDVIGCTGIEYSNCYKAYFISYYGKVKAYVVPKNPEEVEYVQTFSDIPNINNVNALIYNPYNSEFIVITDNFTRILTSKDLQSWIERSVNVNPLSITVNPSNGHVFIGSNNGIVLEYDSEWNLINDLTNLISINGNVERMLCTESTIFGIFTKNYTFNSEVTVDNIAIYNNANVEVVLPEPEQVNTRKITNINGRLTILSGKVKVF